MNLNMIFVGVGDLIGVLMFILFINDDNLMIDVFNVVGLDVSVVGNYEFD